MWFTQIITPTPTKIWCIANVNTWIQKKAEERVFQLFRVLPLLLRYNYTQPMTEHVILFTSFIDFCARRTKLYATCSCKHTTFAIFFCIWILFLIGPLDHLCSLWLAMITLVLVFDAQLEIALIKVHLTTNFFSFK